jgi:anaerobic magnesium-protoporphyrin IX monomethyl ester cyclase
VTTVLLIYPYFKPPHDRSVFRFPPLGPAYVAAALLRAGHEVSLLDCTFLKRDEALRRALARPADIVGIYGMVTMLDDCLWLARQLRAPGRLLVAGGPLPTCDPEAFLGDFDAVVRGEGEETMTALADAVARGLDWHSVSGLAYPAPRGSPGQKEPETVFTPDRPPAKDLDALAFPARHLLPNADYVRHGRGAYGFAITTVMSTRGCPFRCEFCSNVIFGGSYRERSARSVVDEIEQALGLGYEQISFADDVFTLNRARVREICAEIARRGLRFQWECLGRVDAMDYATARLMKQAGCRRIYFGIESGNEETLRQMRKQITLEQARHAVHDASRAGLEVGAFFILFYPGETGEMVLNSLSFAASLPLDYLGLTLPYPLPGTALHERIKDRINRDWRPGEAVLGGHVLIYKSEFSELKMRFGLAKGQIQFRLNRRLGGRGGLGRWAARLFEHSTDFIFRRLR